MREIACNAAVTYLLELSYRNTTLNTYTLTIQFGVEAVYFNKCQILPATTLFQSQRTSGLDCTLADEWDAACRC